MTDDSQLPEQPEDDPEVAALLGFAPVERGFRRRDGWHPEVQRGFIAALVRLGNSRLAAHAVGRTESGAYKVRYAAGAESFAAAWDSAIELFRRRNPLDRRGGPPGGQQDGFEARGRRREPAEPDFEPDDPEAEERLKLEVGERIIHRYIRMLDQERTARLEGRIVEADFRVRQLTFIEIVLDLGGQAQRVLQALAPSGRFVTDVVATPMSVYLDGIRRRYWSLRGEPDRPELGELGHHDDRIATGPCHAYMPARDGPSMKAWEQRREAQNALAAAAQAAWEEKARREAEAWRKRVEGEDGEDGEDGG